MTKRIMSKDGKVELIFGGDPKEQAETEKIQSQAGLNKALTGLIGLIVIGMVGVGAYFIAGPVFSFLGSLGSVIIMVVGVVLHLGIAYAAIHNKHVGFTTLEQDVAIQKKLAGDGLKQYVAQMSGEDKKKLQELRSLGVAVAMLTYLVILVGTWVFVFSAANQVVPLGILGFIALPVSLVSFVKVMMGFSGQVGDNYATKKISQGSFGQRVLTLIVNTYMALYFISLLAHKTGALSQITGLFS